jgi:hypothetical protein
MRYAVRVVTPMVVGVGPRARCAAWRAMSVVVVVGVVVGIPRRPAEARTLWQSGAGGVVVGAGHRRCRVRGLQLEAARGGQWWVTMGQEQSMDCAAGWLVVTREGTLPPYNTVADLCLQVWPHLVLLLLRLVAGVLRGPAMRPSVVVGGLQGGVGQLCACVEASRVVQVEQHCCRPPACRAAHLVVALLLLMVVAPTPLMPVAAALALDMLSIARVLLRVVHVLRQGAQSAVCQGLYSQQLVPCWILPPPWEAALRWGPQTASVAAAECSRCPRFAPGAAEHRARSVDCA